MDSLLIEGKAHAPAVNFNAESGVLSIAGRSIPEHPVKFYEPLENWVVEFLKTNPSKVFLTVYLDYLNTHSTECMLILIKTLEEYLISNPTVEVKAKWNFDEDDEDMADLGKDLATITKVPFEFEEIIED